MNRIRFSSLGCALVCLLVTGSAGAQTSPETAPALSAHPARTMTLTEAITFAKAHQPEVRAALARVEAQKADADVPRAQWQPTLGATAQLFGATANNTTGTYVSTGTFDIPRIGGTRSVNGGNATWKPYATTFVGAGLTQEVFDFGRIAAQAAASDALVDVAKQRARATALDVTFDVEEAYFAVLAAKSVQKASDDAYERARVHRDLAKAGVDSGMHSPIELTRAEADLARFDTGRIRARGGLATAQITLAAAMGAPDGAIDAAPLPDSSPDLPTLQSAMAQAAARDPRLLAIFAELRAQEEKTRAIGAELRPDFSVTGTISGRAGGAQPSGNGIPAGSDGWVPNVPNWDVGIVLSWPLFDGVVNARKDASRAQEEVRKQEVAAVRQEEEATIRVAYGTVDVARATLPGLQRSVEAARANDAQAEARFKAGMGTSVELADAEALRTDAEIQLALGQFQLARARAAFGRAIAEGF